jgi:hypothetical protein
LADAVTVLPSGVGGSIRRIQHAYDDMSRPRSVASYTAASGGSIVNEVSWVYNPWGLVAWTKQSHDGGDDGSTPKIVYNYADGAVGGEAKYVRLASVVYPKRMSPM